MASTSAIEWTEATWNPVTGCSKVSPGCAHCYAESIELRFKRSLQPWTPANAAENVKLWSDRLGQPQRWQRPRMIFVCSMADLFHELVPDEFIGRVFAAMASAPHHTFQVLTKRPERMATLLRDTSWEWSEAFARGYEDRKRTPPWPLPNVWLGTTIENRRFVHRADLLRETPAAVRFVSAEPLLGPLVFEPDEWLDLTGIDWLICGGESGPRCRRFELDWARDLRAACAVTGTAFFLKQLGGHPDKRGGDQALLDGHRHTDMPTLEVAHV